MTHALTMEDGINAAIERAAKDIKFWVKEAGHSFDIAAARVKSNCTLGPKSWEKVVARAAELVK